MRPVHEVEQGKQEDPHDVDEVPVQADISTGVYHSSENRPFHAIHATTLRMPKPITMCSACSPVIAKYSDRKICTCAACGPSK